MMYVGFFSTLSLPRQPPFNCSAGDGSASKKAQVSLPPSTDATADGEKESMVVWPPMLRFEFRLQSVSHNVTVQNRMTEICPPLSWTFHFRGVFYFIILFFCLFLSWRGSVVIFQAGRTSLPTQRGYRGECGKRLCGSPKINNEPSYTTCLSSLDVNGKSSVRRSIGAEAAAAVAVVGGWRCVRVEEWWGLNRCISRITNYALVVIFEGERRFDLY